jgi:hypothetical protein
MNTSTPQYDQNTHIIMNCAYTWRCIFHLLQTSTSMATSLPDHIITSLEWSQWSYSGTMKLLFDSLPRFLAGLIIAPPHRVTLPPTPSPNGDPRSSYNWHFGLLFLSVLIHRSPPMQSLPTQSHISLSIPRLSTFPANDSVKIVKEFSINVNLLLAKQLLANAGTVCKSKLCNSIMKN